MSIPDVDKSDNSSAARVPFKLTDENLANVEATQKISIDYKEVSGKDYPKEKSKGKKRSIVESSVTGSITLKSIFNRKIIADDYVKSDTLPAKIASIAPLKDKLELQDVNNNYELREKFTEGTQGEIRNAFDRSLKRDIVVKSLKIDDSEENNDIDKDESLFVSEARIMAQLDHPSIIPLYGLHCSNESRLHLAMKRIRGKTLKEYLQNIIDLYEREGVDNFDEKRSTANRIEYIIKICEAIDYAHCKGVIHRDLKPENIMIGNYGEVYVMDWGLACLTDSDSINSDNHTTMINKSTHGELVGTPCYIAPELIRGGVCSPQSDIFSLGILLFEVVTLTRAVPGEKLKEVFRNIINGKFNPFKHRFLKKSIPNDLKAIIKKATCESLSHRYRSAGEMAGDLKLFLMSEETAARPDNIFRKYIRSMLNHKMLTSVVIMSLLLCLSAIAIGSLHSQNRLMKEQDMREAMLSSFQDGVSTRANKMENVFFYFKTQLGNVAYNAGLVLSSHDKATEKIYTLDDYHNSSLAPADYAYSPLYGIKISLSNAVFLPGPTLKSIDKADTRVTALQKIFKHMMYTSNPEFKSMKEKEIQYTIRNTGAPLSWVSVGLKNGIMFSYPGTSSFSAAFDPRVRPWYKKALTQKNDTIWSEPYRCAVSDKMLIACIRCIYDENKVFQGVASMDIRLDYIQKNVFHNKPGSGFKEYLLDNNGRVILSSNFNDQHARTDKKRNTLIMKRFPFQDEFREALANQQVKFEAVKYGTKYVFAFNRLPSLGYYYIQQISEKKLMNTWKRKALGQ